MYAPFLFKKTRDARARRAHDITILLALPLDFADIYSNIFRCECRRQLLYYTYMQSTHTPRGHFAGPRNRCAAGKALIAHYADVLHIRASESGLRQSATYRISVSPLCRDISAAMAPKMMFKIARAPARQNIGQ